MTDFVIEKPKPRAPIITIFGDAGVGKNSLATAMARNPIVIRAEDGVARQSKKLEMPSAFPVCGKAQDVFDQLLWLIQNDHEFTDLIFDSASGADALFVADVIEKGGKNNIAQAYGGYGAGYGAVSSMHGRVRKAAGILNERKGMQVIFIVHADLENMRLPDVDDYMRYSLRLTTAKNANSIAHYVDNVDMVAHVRLCAALRGDEDERKKVISTGDREIVCHATAASVTKNGLGIVDALDFPEGSNPFAPYLWPDAEDKEDEKPVRRRRRAEPKEDVEEVEE